MPVIKLPENERLILLKTLFTIYFSNYLLHLYITLWGSTSC